MHRMKIAITPKAIDFIETEREKVPLQGCELTEIGAAVVSLDDVENGELDRIRETYFGIPVFLLLEKDQEMPADLVGEVSGVFNMRPTNYRYYGKQLDQASRDYETRVLPPFFGKLVEYVARGNAQYTCPGHQGGSFYRKHPAGRAFYDHFGENLFRSDLDNSDVEMGDLLVHEGPALAAEKHAAKVYNADKTYFVLNGTSTSNQVVLNAALARGDLVLYDRNNHKSVVQGALIEAGATPVYLQTSRNGYGFIGGVYEECFDENYIREQIRRVAPEKADLPKPFRMCVIQLGTYDGTIYNAKQVVEKIGHLCDYVFFDSAWVGYEQFIPMMRDCSPMLLELTDKDPGIFVTQSVHKQQAGFSMASQIHKKDRNIKGQKGYIPHNRFNNSFMLHASTSPFYPMFSCLDVNAKIHEGEAGKKLWRDCVKCAIDARKLLIKTCRYVRPFVPPMVHGKPWQDAPTEEIANDIDFWRFDPQAKWHGYEGFGPNQYFVDPCKFNLTTAGINRDTGEYEEFGIPASVLDEFLQENHVIPEKNNMNSILFLMTPAEDPAKMDHLITQIRRFEQYIDADAPMEVVLPRLYASHQDRYKGYTIRQLCQEMHDFYKNHDAKSLQKAMFLRKNFPKMATLPIDAHLEYVRGNVDLVPISQAVGRVAAEGSLPYPPGVLCCIPGEVWNEGVAAYFELLEKGVDVFPGFSPEIEGVFRKPGPNGKIVGHSYVLNKEAEDRLLGPNWENAIDKSLVRNGQ